MLLRKSHIDVFVVKLLPDFYVNLSILVFTGISKQVLSLEY